MKSPPTVTSEDCDDIFGPPRTYPTGYQPPKNRPSMISPKYRQKEERRKVLKISLNKMRKIEDPESSLCRSVLINNTMKRLQKEARDEKVQKQQLNYPRCYDNDNFLNLKSDGGKSGNFESQSYGVDDKLIESFTVENDFDTKLAEEIETVNGLGLVSELSSTFSNDSELISEAPPSSVVVSQKRSFDEVDDCDVQDVLSQLYMPPTPRMLTCIDDDEDVNVDVVEPAIKKAKLDDSITTTTTDQEKIDSTVQDIKCDIKSSTTTTMTMTTTTATTTSTTDFCVNSFINNNIPATTSESSSRLRYSTQNVDTDNSFSCGHASMFSEFQSNVYHNLIASLET